jgi:DNA-binding NtrC family response regulator
MIKILIVDDDQLICKHLKKFFGEVLGHTVFTVSNPKEAMPVIEKEAPHVVLLDVLMEEMSGLDLLKEIKEKYGNTVKVIMITITGGKDATEAKLLGADEFIRKPFERDYLRDVVMDKIQEVLNYDRKDLPKDKIPNILVVDDEKEVLEEVRFFLKRVIECDVDIAKSGEDAFGLIKKNNYDLIFLDIKMPGMSGLDLIKRVKPVKPLPDIVIITGYADGDIATRCQEAGAIGYIPKPIYLDNFKKTVKEILTKKGKYFEKG